MTLACWCLIEQDRMKSSPIVELCVGTIDRPARYRWAGLSTSTQRTGTESTRRTSAIVTGRVSTASPPAVNAGSSRSAPGRRVAVVTMPRPVGHWCEASATMVVPSDRSIS